MKELKKKTKNYEKILFLESGGFKLHRASKKQKSFKCLKKTSWGARLGMPKGEGLRPFEISKESLLPGLKTTAVRDWYYRVIFLKINTEREGER